VDLEQVLRRLQQRQPAFEFCRLSGGLAGLLTQVRDRTFEFRTCGFHRVLLCGQVLFRLRHATIQLLDLRSGFLDLLGVHGRLLPQRGQFGLQRGEARLLGQVLTLQAGLLLG
jgi:hypothetical protein